MLLVTLSCKPGFFLFFNEVKGTVYLMNQVMMEHCLILCERLQFSIENRTAQTLPFMFCFLGWFFFFLHVCEHGTAHLFPPDICWCPWTGRDLRLCPALQSCCLGACQICFIVTGQVRSGRFFFFSHSPTYTLFRQSKLTACHTTHTQHSGGLGALLLQIWEKRCAFLKLIRSRKAFSRSSFTPHAV